MARIAIGDDDDDGTVEIWPENADAVRLFFGLSSQWRTASLSGPGFAMIVRTGLDLSAMPAVAGALRLDVDARLLSQLRTIESAAIATMDEDGAARLQETRR